MRETLHDIVNLLLPESLALPLVLDPVCFLLDAAYDGVEVKVPLLSEHQGTTFLSLVQGRELFADYELAKHSDFALT